MTHKFRSMAVLCMVSLISGNTIASEQVDRMVYKNISVSEDLNSTIVTFQAVNNGSKAQPICAPVILAKKSNGRYKKVMSINKLSSTVPTMTPGKPYQLRFAFPVTGENRVILYGGGLRFAAKQHIHRY